MAMTENITAGLCVCGSFCTLKEVFLKVEELVALGIKIVPIMSFHAYSLNTRFGTAEDNVKRLEDITGKTVIHTIEDAEPIGPGGLLDIIIVAPCTGNTLAKIANGITDTPVTMAVKAHIRNGKPVVIAPCTNDALGANAKNYGLLINSKNIFFVPWYQDDTTKKPQSMVADLKQLYPTIVKALEFKQIQPVMIIK